MGLRINVGDLQRWCCCPQRASGRGHTESAAACREWIVVGDGWGLECGSGWSWGNNKNTTLHMPLQDRIDKRGMSPISLTPQSASNGRGRSHSPKRFPLPIHPFAQMCRPARQRRTRHDRAWGPLLSWPAPQRGRTVPLQSDDVGGARGRLEQGVPQAECRRARDGWLRGGPPTGCEAVAAIAKAV
jgi:hypothetical protein